MVNRYDEQTLLGYIEGDLSPPQREAFEGLLASDPKLQRLVTQLCADRDRLRHLPPEPAPPALMDQVDRHLERTMLLDTLEPEAQVVTQKRGLRMRRWVAYSGLAAMVMVSAAFVVSTLVDRKLYDQFTSSAPTKTAGAGKTVAMGHDDPVQDHRASGAMAFRAQQGALDSPRKLKQDRVSHERPGAVAFHEAKQNQSNRLAQERSDAAAPGESEADEVLAIITDSPSRLTRPAVGDQDQATSSPGPVVKIETFARLQGPKRADQPRQVVPHSPLAQRVRSLLDRLEPADHPSAVASGQGPQESEGLLVLRQLQSADESKSAIAYADPPGTIDTNEASKTHKPSRPRHPQTDLDILTANQTFGPKPELRVAVSAAAPDSAQRVLLSWAVANQVQIVSIHSDNGAASTAIAGQPRPAGGGSGAKHRPAGATRWVVLTLTADQLGSLLATLNEERDQTARVIPQPPWLERLPQGPAAQPSPPGQSDNAWTISSLAATQWGGLLFQHLPLTPTVPTYAPQTQVMVWVRIQTAPAISRPTATP